MSKYPKYRVRITLGTKYEDEFTPQIKTCIIGSWNSLDANLKNSREYTTSVNDILNVHISKSHLSNCAFSTELGARMTIKFYDIQHKYNIALTEKNKHKKKIRYINNIDPSTL